MNSSIFFSSSGKSPSYDKLKKINEIINYALVTSRMIDDEKDRYISLTVITGALARVGMIDRAYELAREIPDKSLSLNALCSIADILIDVGEIERADKTLRETLRIAKDITEKSEITWSLVSIAKVLAKLGRVIDALEVTRDILDPYDRSIALRDIALVLIEKQKVNEAIRVLEEAVKVARSVDKNYRRALAMTALVNVYRDIKNSRAKEILDEAYISAIGEPYTNLRASSLSDIAVMYATMGFHNKASMVIEEALSDARKVPEEPYRSFALKDVVVALAKVKGVDVALETARRIPLKDVRSYAMRNIVEYLSEAGEIEKALAIAKDIDESFKRERADALKHVAYALIKKGELSVALKVINDALKIARKIKDEDDRDYVLKELTKTYAEIGQIKTAFEIAEEISNRSSALRVLVEILAKNERFEEALDLAMNIPSEIDKTYALVDVFVKMAVSLGVALSIDISRTVITEDEELEIKINSGFLIENVVIEFDGVKAEPVKMRRLKNEIIRIKPDFEPGRKIIKVRVTYDYEGKRHTKEREIEVEFKPSYAVEQVKRKHGGERFLNYDLIRRVGSGTFADVYEARDEDGRVVALKIYRSSEQNFIEEIGNFAQLTRKLQYVPYIVRPLKYGVSPKPYVVMDLYPMTLRDLIEQEIELKKKMRLIYRIAKVLAYAHSQKIYHGDLKPENVLVSIEADEYYPAISDWGGGFTPGYSAPEVYKSKGKYISEKSDVYSFGVILYELLMGKRLFIDPLDYIERCENIRVELSYKKLEDTVNSCLLRESQRPRMEEIMVKIADYIATDLGTWYSRGIMSRDALEIISVYMDLGRLDMAGGRLKTAEKLISREIIIVIEKVIELMRIVYEYRSKLQSIPSDIFEQKIKGIIDLLDYETARRIEQDKFSPIVFTKLIEISPQVQDSLLMSIDRMKDIIIGKYIKELHR